MFAPYGMRARNTLEALLQNYGTLLPADMANTKKIRHSNKKRPNRNFAIAAAPAAMPVNPNSAATIAITKKITAQRNIVSPPRMKSNQAIATRGYFARLNSDN